MAILVGNMALKFKEGRKEGRKETEVHFGDLE